MFLVDKRSKLIKSIAVFIMVLTYLPVLKAGKSCPRVWSQLSGNKERLVKKFDHKIQMELQDKVNLGEIEIGSKYWIELEGNLIKQYTPPFQLVHKQKTRKKFAGDNQFFIYTFKDKNQKTLKRDARQLWLKISENEIFDIRKIYEEGDIVFLDHSKGPITIRIEGLERELNLPEQFNGAPAVVVKHVSESKLLIQSSVEIMSANSKPQNVVFTSLVGAAEISKPRMRGRKDFNKRLTLFRFSGKQFEKAEVVRVRTSEGSMTEAEVLAVGDQRVKLHIDGKQQWVSNASVFKKVFSNETRSSTSELLSFNEFTRPHQEGKDFLNLMAEYSSTSSFLKLNSSQKLKSYFAFFQSLMVYSSKAELFDYSFVDHANKFLCLGIGVCRHLVPIFWSALVELGLKPQVVVLPREHMKGSRSGHTWIELTLNNHRKGKDSRLIIDPSYEEYGIIPYSQMLKWNKSHPEYWRKELYLNSRKQYLDDSN